MDRRILFVGLASALAVTAGLVWLTLRPGSPEHTRTDPPASPSPREHVDGTSLPRGGPGSPSAGSQKRSETNGAGAEATAQGDWWSDEADLSAYYRAFDEHLAELQQINSGAASDESLGRLRSLDNSLQENPNDPFRGVGWAELGALDLHHEVEYVHRLARQAKSDDVRWNELDQESDLRRIGRNPFSVRPELALQVAAGRQVALTHAQLREIEPYYWRYLGERARFEADYQSAEGADHAARQTEKGNVFAPLPPGSDLLPFAIHRVHGEIESVNQGYMAELRGFVRQNGL